MIIYDKKLLLIPISFISIYTIKQYINRKITEIIIHKINDETIHQNIHNVLLKISKQISNDPKIHKCIIDMIDNSLIKNDIIVDKLIDMIKSNKIKTSLNELIYTTINTQLQDDKNIKLLSSTFYNILYITVAQIILSTKTHIMFWKNN